MLQKIAILNPGMMGIAVAKTMKNSGHKVFWMSKGRSEATRQRAEALKLIELQSMAQVAEQCDAIVSVCPPHAAKQLAESVSESGFKGIYLDANAIAPRTSLEIFENFKKNCPAVRFVDGSITGPPPTKKNQTWLYLSGKDAPEVATWFDKGPLEVQILDDKIGSASSLKMCFAAYTKGTNALLTSILGAAESMGVRKALEGQWERYWPGFTQEKEAKVTRIAHKKAWRFEGEMHQMVTTFKDVNAPHEFFDGAAETYARIGHLKEQDSVDILDVCKAVSTPKDEGTERK